MIFFQTPGPYPEQILVLFITQIKNLLIIIDFKNQRNKLECPPKS